MLRRWTILALVVALAFFAGGYRPVRADTPIASSESEGSEEVPPGDPDAPHEIPLDDKFEEPEELLSPERTIRWPREAHVAEPEVWSELEMGAGPSQPTGPMSSKLKRLGLRHSSTHGRNVGMGVPLVSTSWLNRPYYFGADIGTVWIMRPIKDHMTDDIDMFGDVFGGCDWDHYWGIELAVHRATPEIKNEQARDADRGDRLMEWTASMMYYPWGDAMFRPYWRFGIGATEIDYPTDGGHRRNEELWTFPIGVGVKYPVRRWLARGPNSLTSSHLAMTVFPRSTISRLPSVWSALCARPCSYWPWNPSRHIW